MDRRYAIYAAPPAGSTLARWGAAWLGRDAERDVAVVPPALPGWSAPDIARVTAAPRLYGLHATLKPPFRLAAGSDEAGLHAAIDALARTTPPPPPVPLHLVALDRFVALVPAAPAPALYRLADACVAELDGFRALPGAAELAKRSAAPINPRQRAHLARWGYPYVFDQFRFHITLSGALVDDERARLLRDFAPVLALVIAETLRLADIALFVQDDGAAFRLVRRFPLAAPGACGDCGA